MYRKSSVAALFAGNGFARREFFHHHVEIFNHQVIAVPKAYPDAQLLLERRGLRSKEIARGQFYQLNLYTTDFYDLPDALFIDPQINWHRQQLGQKGLIAAAGLWVRDAAATISTIQSDICQQLYRHSTLRHSCKTRVDKRFRYWYALLFNAVLDFCLELNLLTLRCPTGQQIVANTSKSVQSDLFCRIYDYPNRAFACRKTKVRSAEYWDISVEANRDRIIPLSVLQNSVVENDSNGCLCIFHDIEENVNTPIAADECAENLQRMLEIEKSFGVDATYNVLGVIFERKNSVIRASNRHHSIGFHSFNHRLNDLAQLPKCRNVSLRVRGYRPPNSRITNELTDYALTKFNFEWFACSANSLGHSDCRLQSGLVKIPIHIDDHRLHLGQPYEEWRNDLLQRTSIMPFFALGLHDCYASKWLGRYADLLDELLSMKKLVRADDVCDGVLLAAPLERENQSVACRPSRRLWPRSWLGS
jgi:hypothetical protein